MRKNNQVTKRAELALSILNNKKTKKLTKSKNSCRNYIISTAMR